ncbi:MAG TPA: hypothetical protein VMF89_17385 [Polyangiales bacterium]|nr:hypothetical protein [Polyangiales bacterium]
MKHALWLLALMCCACRDDGERGVATDVSTAVAARPLTDKIDIPDKAPDVLANMAQTHANVELESDEDASLNFSVALPKSWIQRKAPANFRQALFPARALATFAPEPKNGGAVAVVAAVAPITHEIPLDAWSRATFEQEGYKIVDAHWFPGPSGLFFDITGRRTEPNGEIVRRSSVRQDGARLFMLNAISPIDQWDEVKGNIWAAHMTFELLKARGGTAEERRKIVARDPGFRIEYPESWEAEVGKARDRGVSGVHLRLPTPDNTDLAAYLFVRAAAAADGGVDALLEKALQVAAKSGLSAQAKPVWLTDEEDPRSIAVEGYLGGYSVPARMGTGDIILKLGFVRREGLDFMFVLCSPKPSVDLLNALRAQRTLEIARASLELPLKGKSK